MYLKSIEVNGFKSFANKITFTFPYGITGIVGPNGSGKSNIADAVRWVLGEQSAKQLRGSRMEDVIFSGTENRKPMGYAFVAITFENDQHIIPVDYKEVTVARRVYRSGESEYLLNGSVCRRKDIVSLFYDTGIGKEGYSIIGQGQVEKILSGKIEDSRELFDEAAGIAKYKKNRAVTMKSLEQERQDLARVTDILNELEKQIGPLEEQSKTAKEYLRLKEEEKDLDLHIFLYDHEHMNKELDDLAQREKIVSGDLEETRDKYDQIKQENQELLADAERIAERMEESENKRDSLRRQKEEKEADIQTISSQIEANTRLMSHYHELAGEAALDAHQKKEAASQAESEKKNKEKELDDLKEKLHTFEEELEEKNRIHEEYLSKDELMQQEILSMMSSRTGIKEKLSRYETLEEQLKIRSSEYEGRLLLVTGEIDHSRKEEETVRTSIDESRQELARLEEKWEEQKKEEQQIREAISQLSGQADQLRQDQMRTRTRYESLANMSERYDGYNRSIRHIMEEKKNNAGIIGVVADIISVDKKYETAIEIALGSSLQNIVTEDNEVAQKMIRRLKKNQFGRATFLPLTNMRRRNISFSPAILEDEGVIGVASSLVEAEDKFTNLIASLLGRTIVVDNYDHALSLVRKNNFSLRIVTLGGELFNPGGSITGGMFRHSANLLGRRREMDEAKELLKKYETDLKDRIKELDAEKQLLEKSRTESDKLSEQIDDLRLKLSGLEASEPALTNKISELESEEYKIRRDHRIIADQMATIKDQKKKLALEEEDSVRLHEKSNESMEELEEKLRKIEAELTQMEEKRQELTLAITKMTQEISFLEETMERLSREEQEARSRSEDNAGKEKDLLTQNSDLSRQSDRIKKELAGDLHELEEIMADSEKLKEERNRINKEQKLVFDALDSENERLLVLEKENTRLKARQEKLHSELDARVEYIWDQYELTYHNILPLKKYEIGDREISARKKDKKNLEKKIRDLGAINVNAIEEYQEKGERYAFLKKQSEDIQEAEARLVDMINELNRNMRSQFREQFALIREQFTQVFSDLFEGGRASLELMDEENILECGIRIIAQPPGKKLQNILLLSGGERALTAIALLFAIQKLKPSPFCLLDEIEAALDDANIIRFSKYLKRLSEQTQYIVITHRRGTMNVAQSLYGITMQEKGVSTLVSVDLIDEEMD